MITGIIVITGIIMIIEPRAFLHLLTWLSPAFPTGAFAYSHGLEWAVAAGDVGDGESLRAWLATLLGDGSGRNDAILLRAAHRASAAPARLDEIAAIGAALAPAAERRAETLAQGAAFAKAAVPWGGPWGGLWGSGSVAAPLPIVLGVLAARHGIGEEVAVIGYLHAFAANLISAGVRLIPLGQSAGLVVLAALEADILAIAAESRGQDLDDLGAACFRADIAAMRHETQYTRLFRS